VVLGLEQQSVIGLSPATRIVLQFLCFLHELLPQRRSLIAAIISPATRILPLPKSMTTPKQVCLDLINDARRF